MLDALLPTDLAFVYSINITLDGMQVRYILL